MAVLYSLGLCSLFIIFDFYLENQVFSLHPKKYIMKHDDFTSAIIINLPFHLLAGGTLARESNGSGSGAFSIYQEIPEIPVGL